MRVFITGIAGFIGSHLADYLIAQGHEVYGCDDLSTGEHANVPLKVKLWSHISIEDLKPRHLQLPAIDIVFHCAAAAYEGASHFAPAFISRNIYAGSSVVFEAAIVAGVKRIVHCSSMAVYGEPRRQGDNFLPFREEDPLNPVDPYGIAKAATERLLINLCETHGRQWAIARPHNVYGPRQRYVDPYRNVAAIFSNLMLQGQQPHIYGTGHQVRCFSYIDDVVPSLAKMGFLKEARGEIINIGPDQGATSIIGLARRIAEIIGFDLYPVFLPPRPREVQLAACCSDKARRLLGFEQRTELWEGLERLVAWIREHGPRPFVYHLPLEIQSPLIPKIWI